MPNPENEEQSADEAHGKANSSLVLSDRDWGFWFVISLNELIFWVRTILIAFIFAHIFEPTTASDSLSHLSHEYKAVSALNLKAADTSMTEFATWIQQEACEIHALLRSSQHSDFVYVDIYSAFGLEAEKDYSQKELETVLDDALSWIPARNGAGYGRASALLRHSAGRVEYDLAFGELIRDARRNTIPASRLLRKEENLCRQVAQKLRKQCQNIPA